MIKRGSLALILLLTGCPKPQGPQSQKPPSEVPLSSPEKKAEPETLEPTREPLVLDIVHTNECKAYARGLKCAVTAHWQVKAGQLDLSDPSTLETVIWKESARKQIPPPEESEMIVVTVKPEGKVLKKKALSDRKVLIRGDSNAPWGIVQRITRNCLSTGIYKIDWMASPSRLDMKPLSVWLSQYEDPPQSNDTAVLEEIRLFLRVDPESGAIRRKVNNGNEARDDSELKSTIELFARDYKALRREAPVMIDAGSDVPWSAVVHALEICRQSGVFQIDFRWK